MDKFELLSDLADGVLDSSQEQELFAELAINEELRGEFKQLLSFNSTIKSNRALFDVNSGSTNAIFSAIGIPTAGVVSATNIATNSATAVSVFNFAKYSQAIISAGVATLTTAALFLLFLNFYGEDFFAGKSNVNNIGNSEILTQNEYNNNVQNSSPVISPSENLSSSEKIKYIYIEKKAEDKPLTKNDLAEVQYIEINPKSNDKPIIIDPIDLKKVQNSNLPVYELDEFLAYHNQVSKKSFFEIEARGFQNWHIETETISPSKIANFNNLGISAIINIDKSLSLGFELRQETFFQKFNGVDMLGQFNLYEQQPNFTTYGMMIRYGYNVSDYFKPIAQISIGGANVGFIGRFMGGLQYKFTDELKFIIGLEYSNLFYNYQSQTFNSDKVGINYGISYSF